MTDFLSNSILFTAVLSWFVAQVLKVIGVIIKYKRIDFSRFVGSGGMPSSHTSLVMSLSTAVGLTEGFTSTVFAVSVIMSLVVMYDAAGVRRAAGQQARILNKMVEEWENKNFTDTDKKLKELLGHTPVEVFAGALLGIGIALIRHL